MQLQAKPTFAIPLGVTLTAAVGFTGFALVLGAVASEASPVVWPWLPAAGLFFALAASAWAGLLHAIGTRRVFRGCVLRLERPAFRLDQPVSFSISDPHRRLRSAGAFELGLAWLERSTRVGGRKTYIEGPFVLPSRPSWAFREALPATAGPGLTGAFEVASREIQLSRQPEWTQRVDVLVRVRTRRWRSCSFVLPLEEGGPLQPAPIG